MNTYKLTQTGPETQDILDEVNVLRTDVDANTEDIEQLQELYEAFINGGVVIIQPTDTWPVANPTQKAVYRVIDRENTPPEYYADYMWNGTSFVKMAQYDNNIDDEPTADSDNLVKSGGVVSYVENYVATNGSAFDISVANASGGVPAEYADLADALGTNGANVPSAVRKGGMSVKFIQQTPASYSVVVTPGAAEAPTGGVLLDADPEITSGSHTASDLTALSTESALPTSVGGTKTYYFAVTGDTTTYTTLVVTLVQNVDHKYVQWRLMKKTWSTTVSDWQGVDDVPTEGSDNLVKSGGVNSWCKDNYGEYIVSTDWLKVEIDGERNIISGVKSDGSHYAYNMHSETIDKNAEDIETLGETKQNIEEGKGLIDEEIADRFSMIEKPGFMSYEVDEENKIISYRKNDGTKVENILIETPAIHMSPVNIDGIEDGSRLEVKIDSEQKILSYRDREGVLYENSGIVTPRISLKEAGISELKQALDIGDIDKTTQTLNSILYSGSYDLHIISVKKDGTGDFTTIQGAINSITDASVVNQYEVQVYDDFYVNNLNELWSVTSPTTQNTSNNPTSFVAYIITKDYVHLRGVRGRRTIYVENPNISMTGSSFQNIHNIFVLGNCKVENFTFKIKGGRYAIHQDLSGSRFGSDSFKTSILKDVTAIHYGNSDYTNGSGWSSCFAQANGIANGSTQIFINVIWDAYEWGAFYAHTNENYTIPCSLVMYNCKYIDRRYRKSIGSQSCSIIDRFSRQRNEYYIYNSNLPGFYAVTPGSGTMGDNAFPSMTPTERVGKKLCLNEVSGHGNAPMVVKPEYFNSLKFITANIGYKIEVIGGTAKDDIFGDEFKRIFGNDIKGSTTGDNWIKNGTYSHIYSLAYILGNCANSPKTLIIRLTDTSDSYIDYTISFDENYMTEDGSAYQYNTTPHISDDDIINSINTEFGSYFTASLSSEIITTMDDCWVDGTNSDNTSFIRGNILVRDYASGYNCWRKANAGEKPQGVASETIPTDSIGKILLVEKNLFHRGVLKIGSDVTKGTLYKVGSDAILTVTSNENEATMIAVDVNVIMYKF